MLKKVIINIDLFQMKKIGWYRKLFNIPNVLHCLRPRLNLKFKKTFILMAVVDKIECFKDSRYLSRYLILYIKYIFLPITD